MRKVLSFSAFLVVGLFIAQYLPAWSGSGDTLFFQKKQAER